MFERAARLKTRGPDLHEAMVFFAPAKPGEIKQNLGLFFLFADRRGGSDRARRCRKG